MLRAMAWQICLFILLAVSCSHGHVHIGSTFENIKGSIEKLEEEFNASRSDVAEGGSVFIHKLDDVLWSQANEKKILIAQIISMYLQMLYNASKTSTSKHYKELIEALEDYKMKYSESLKKANDLIQLANLPMDDLKTQRKAVAEMEKVLQQVKIEENKRRRRSKGQNLRCPKRCIPNYMG